MKLGSELPSLEVIVSRYEILEQVDMGVVEKRKMNDNLEASRTTIDRSVRELEAANVLERRNGSCEFTRYGRIVYEEFRETVKAAEKVKPASELLAMLPPNSPIGATIANADAVEMAPERAPVTALEDLGIPPDCNTIRASLPVVFSQQLQAIRDYAKGGTTLEILTHPDLVSLIQRRYPEVCELLDRSSSGIHSASELPEFGLIVYGSEEVRVCVYEGMSQLSGVLQNQDADAVSEAISIFEENKRVAEPAFEVEA
ncbi:HTH domain protein (plasmid) [Halobacterium hubeiense]|uniref:HTH domain protein n=1 Tax=Halobacterium hubeiense TaxID=1407499 RepID=A0A0U5H8L3_9EURY|nr:hypothetical protein [Halobacterium hubeiense]CQH63927.1 HTH domain protein [Halobacterium hubeiense]